MSPPTSGGALDIQGTGEGGGDRDDFRANLAGSGGAIADEAGTTTMQFYSCTFDQNRALRGNGGALFAPLTATGYLDIYDSLLINNAANDASMGAGGAIDVSGGNLDLRNSQLSGKQLRRLRGSHRL